MNTYADENVAYVSVIVGVTVTMLAVGIRKPNMGNTVAVQPDVPLFKGLTPIMNIVLAYCTYSSLRSVLEYTYSRN